MAWRNVVAAKVGVRLVLWLYSRLRREPPKTAPSPDPLPAIRGQTLKFKVDKS
jgi:hypothetical protein